VATGDRNVRNAFEAAVKVRKEGLATELRQAGVDRVSLHTDRDWLPALQTFFKTRERRAGIAL